MISKLMPYEVAYIAARHFVARVTKPARPWSLADLAGCLPAGWELMPGVEQGDFFPVTIKNVARVIRGGSQRAGA